MEKSKNYIKCIAYLVLAMFMMVAEIDCSVVNATAANGIYGNGTQGIWININASPYTDLANDPDYGKYAYGPSGCAWFASSRARELTGKGISTIYSGLSWYNKAYSYYGFRRGNTLSTTEKALACYNGHVSVVEKVEGDTVYISEGGYRVASYASYGYCRIAAMNKSTLMSSSKDGGFLGFVYLGVPINPDGGLDASVYLNGCDKKGYMVACRVDNPSFVSSVKCATWEIANGQDDLKWRDMSYWFDGNIAKIYVPYSEHGVTDSGVFENHIYINNIMVGSLRHYLSKKTISDGRYHIVLSVDKSYGIDIEGRKQMDGTNVSIYRNTEDNTQTFDITYLEDGYYKILLSGTDKSLDVASGDKMPKANLHLYSWNNTDAQKWMIVDVGNEVYKIVSKCSDKLVDVSGGVFENGRNLWLYNDNDSVAQKWEFKKVFDSLILNNNSAYDISDAGIITGIKPGENTVQKVCSNFSNDNLTCKDAAGKVLSDTDILGTGATINIMDGNEVKAKCTVVIMGDIIGDGEINLRDVTALAQYRLKKTNLTDVQIAAGDVVPDGEINLRDVTLLAQCRLNKAVLPSQQ